MRILFLVSSMQRGGAERVAALLCNQWASSGHDVTLMPTFSGRGECGYPLHDEVRLEYLADHSVILGRRARNKLIRFLSLKGYIRRGSFDIVISFLNKVNIVAILATLGTGLPVIVSERIYPPLLPIGRFWSVLRRLTYPHANTVVAQTEKSARWLEQHCAGSSVAVIPNPLDWPLPSSGSADLLESGQLADRKILLAVGRLVPQKGFHLLIDAFAGLQEEFSEWDLVVLGDGPLREALEERAERLGLGGRVLMPENSEYVARWYERADLFVMSSLYEGFPNALLEAMSYGVCVVSFDCDTGPGEMIRQDSNGYLVPPEGGSAALAAALARLMADEQKRHMLGQEAQKIRKEYSLEAIMPHWNRLIFDSSDRP